MHPILHWLIPLVSAPATLVLLRFISAFNIQPMAIWTIPAATLSVVVSIGGAFVARLSDKNMSKRRRRARFLILLVALLACGFIYDFLLRNPPYDKWETLYDIVAYATYFGAHFTYGFCVAETTTIILDPKK